MIEENFGLTDEDFTNMANNAFIETVTDKLRSVIPEIEAEGKRLDFYKNDKGYMRLRIEGLSNQLNEKVQGLIDEISSRPD